MNKQFLLIPLLFSFVHLYSQGGEILHYTETTGFNHNTAGQSRSLFQTISSSLGLGFVHDTDGSEFDSFSNLQRFDLVIFSNTSGDQGLDANQRANFEQYIANGGSYLGIHAASDTYRHSTANGNRKGKWDWYAETVCGASVQQNPNHTANNYPGVMTFVQTSTVLDNLIPDPWNKPEEYYYWQDGYLSPDFTTILEVSQTGPQVYDVARMTAQIRDLPGGGRAFYTSLGHSASNFNLNTDFGQLMENAILWIRSGATLSLEEEEEEEINKINPKLINPARGKITFLANLEDIRPLVLDVYDMTGKHMLRFEHTKRNPGQLIWENDIELPAGVYSVLVHSKGRYILSEKLLVN